METFLDSLNVTYHLDTNFIFINKNILTSDILDEINAIRSVTNAGNIYGIRNNPFGKGLVILFNEQGKADAAEYMFECED